MKKTGLLLCMAGVLLLIPHVVYVVCTVLGMSQTGYIIKNLAALLLFSGFTLQYYGENRHE